MSALAAAILCDLYAQAIRIASRLYARSTYIPLIRSGHLGPRVGDVRTMLDVAYLLIGSAFLGVCVLYAIACDHL